MAAPATSPSNDHQVHQQSDQQPNSEAPLYRITTLFLPKSGLTETAFYRHWYSVHGPLCVPWALHYNIVEYTQFCTPSDLQIALAKGKGLNPSPSTDTTTSPVTNTNAAEQAQSQSEASSSNSSSSKFTGTSPFPACADFYVRDYEDYLAAFRDAYYLEVIRPDEDTFIDKVEGVDVGGGNVKAIAMMGQCRRIIREGKACVHVDAGIWERWEEYRRRRKTGNQD